MKKRKDFFTLMMILGGSEPQSLPFQRVYLD